MNALTISSTGQNTRYARIFPVSLALCLFTGEIRSTLDKHFSNQKAPLLLDDDLGIWDSICDSGISWRKVSGNVTMARRREIPWSRPSGQRRDAFKFYRVKKPATDEYYRTMHGSPPPPPRCKNGLIWHTRKTKPWLKMKSTGQGS